MIVRPATREDFRKFYGKLPSGTVRALVAERDGIPIGIGGYEVRDGAAVGFSDVSGMTKREIVKASKQLMRMFWYSGLDIVALADDSAATALKHYGFQPWGQYWRLEWQPSER